MLGLGNIVKEKRLKLGLTITELAKKSEISSSYLGKIESNKRVPTLDVLINIAFNLNVSVGCLLLYYELQIGREQNAHVPIEYTEHLESAVSLINFFLGHTQNNPE